MSKTIADYQQAARDLKAKADAAPDLETRNYYLRLWDSAIQDLNSVQNPGAELLDIIAAAVVIFILLILLVIFLYPW